MSHYKDMVLSQTHYGKIPVLSQAPWLTPVILATQEAEIRRMVVQSQPGYIVCEILSRKHPLKKGLVE
jgi:hypothetical protein